MSLKASMGTGCCGNCNREGALVIADERGAVGVLRNAKYCLLVLLLIWVGACSEDQPCEFDPFSIQIPAVYVAGAGSRRVGTIEITAGTGYCEIEGMRIPAAVYQAQTWSAYGLKVFHVIAPTQGELNVIYIYSSDDTLKTVWHESYTRALDYERAAGVVVYDKEIIWANPALRCLETMPNEEQLVSGITITGSQICWSSGPDAIEIESHSYAWYPFQVVDCTDCGATTADGWYEIHAMFQGFHDKTEFGILYLFVDDRQPVKLY